MTWEGSTRRQRLPKDWARIRRQVLRRDPTCRLGYSGCTTTSTEVDHRQRGDNHSPSNLQGVCEPCHKRKTADEVSTSNAQRAQARRRPTKKHPGLR